MIRRGVGCVLALALTFGVACEEGAAPVRGRVLLVGIDGANLRIARPLMNEGRLPNLMRIARAGYFGALRSHFPLHSPRVWTSIATGKLPQKHGILGFSYEDEKGIGRLYLSTDRTTHALWNIASDAGMTVGVVNWWNTYPLEKINGVMVSDHLLSLDFQGRRELTGAAPVARGPIAYPVEWHERVAPLLEPTEPMTGVADPFSEGEEFPPWLDPARLALRYRGDEAVTRIALEIEKDLHPDLMMVFLPGIDRVSHFLWAAVEPESAYAEPPSMTPSQRRVAKDALEQYYEFTDALIGLLAASYGPEDLIVIVSDHGFEAGDAPLPLTGTHETMKALNGIVYAAGPETGRSSSNAPITVNDITPGILAWLGMPVGVDMDGRVPGFLRLPRRDRNASYDRTKIERLEGAESGAEEELIRQLEQLGYLEHGEAE